ncbi:MAG: type II toxin-antitoxin system RelE family toxin [Opitutales bacterium]
MRNSSQPVPKATRCKGVRSLADDPRPIHAKKLSGEEKYRIRIGDYRVLFKVNDLVVTVVVVKIGHRRDVYRK